MPAVMNERKDETTNRPRRKTKLEPCNQEKANHETGKFMRRRSPQPEKYKEPDSQPTETTTGRREE